MFPFALGIFPDSHFLGKFGGTVCARGFVLVVSSVGHLALVFQNFYASVFYQACI